MDPRLQEMLDHYEIRKVLTEYCHGCDRGDAALMASVYTGDDSFDDHGTVQAPGPEYARIMARIINERTEAISHILGQSLVKVDGDTAAAETFFLALFQVPDADGTSRLSQLAGRFVDRLERLRRPVEDQTPHRRARYFDHPENRGRPASDQRHESRTPRQQ